MGSPWQLDLGLILGFLLLCSAFFPFVRAGFPASVQTNYVLPTTMASAQTDQVEKSVKDDSCVRCGEASSRPEASVDINLEARAREHAQEQFETDISAVPTLEPVQVEAPERTRTDSTLSGDVWIYGRFYVYECRCDPINDCNCPCRTKTAPCSFCTGNNCTTTPGGANHLHGMPYMKVEYWDHDYSSADDLLGTTYTDISGYYSMTLNNADNDEGGTNEWYLKWWVASAPWYQTGKIWVQPKDVAKSYDNAYWGGHEIGNLADGAVYDVGGYAWSDSRDAFILYAAIKCSRYMYLNCYGWNMWDQVIYYPGGPTDSAINIKFIEANGEDDSMDDDRVIHEYGHNIMFYFYGNLNPRGSCTVAVEGCSSPCTCGNHWGASNHCSCDAIAEGWATFIAGLVPEEMDSDGTYYRDWDRDRILGTKMMAPQDLESNAVQHEYSETTFQCILWDLLDPGSDGEYAAVPFLKAASYNYYDVNPIWWIMTRQDPANDHSASAEPYTLVEFFDFWKVYFPSGQTTAGELELCNIYSLHGVTREFTSRCSSNCVGYCNGACDYCTGPSNYNEYFYSVDYTYLDSDGDGFKDRVQVRMDVDTTYTWGSLDVIITSGLEFQGHTVDTDLYVTWSISGNAIEYGYAYLDVPAGAQIGLYNVWIYLYDEWNNYEDYTYGSGTQNLYPPDYRVYFYSVWPTAVDSDLDGYHEYAEVQMDVDTTDGVQDVTVYAEMHDPIGNYVGTGWSTWTITSNNYEYGYVYLYVSPGGLEGWYTIYFLVEDSYGNGWLDDATASVYLRPEPLPVLDTYFYSLTFTPNPANLGDPVLIEGALLNEYNDPVLSANVDLEYSFDNTIWTYISSTTTLGGGEFSHTFTPPVAGYYYIRASYAGSATYNPSSRTETLSVTYSATIWAWDSVYGWLSEPITMDGGPTGWYTPHTFTGLAAPHTFTVPEYDGFGNPFMNWTTGETSTTITVSSGGTYTARYYYFIAGDADYDGDVDYDDFIILAGAYGSHSGQPAYKRNADFDGDGDVDYSDFIALAGNYGQHV